MTNQKELNLEEMEKVSGGETIELAGGIKPFISVPIFEKETTPDNPVENVGGAKIIQTQTNQNKKSNQLANIKGANTQVTNTFNFK